MMRDADRFYINGEWVEPTTSGTMDVLDPSTEKPIATVALGGAEDVDRAVKAARAAFETFSTTSVAERIALLERIIEVYQTRGEDLARTLMAELGAPAALANSAQVGAGLGQFASALDALKNFQFDEDRGTTRIRYEAIGVCGLITPWN
jgi:aldehyde dehydrogenase (NAD+)